jgi:hypothetical protein
MRNQYLIYATSTLIFVAMLIWYSNELFVAAQVPESETKWADSELHWSDHVWITQDWLVDPLAKSERPERFRFWFLPSFETSYFVELRKESDHELVVIVRLHADESRVAHDIPISKEYVGTLTSNEIDWFNRVLSETKFWLVPPGEMNGLGCSDGEAHVVETNFGDQYRLWWNSCASSFAMSQLALFFEPVVHRMIWPIDVKTYEGD